MEKRVRQDGMDEPNQNHQEAKVQITPNSGNPALCFSLEDNRKIMTQRLVIGQMLGFSACSFWESQLESW